MMMPDMGGAGADPQLAALLAQLAGGAGAGAGGAVDPMMLGEAEEQELGYMPGDIPRQLIDLTHEAIRMEPDAADKSLLGKILSMLLQYQERQRVQGQ